MASERDSSAGGTAGGVRIEREARAIVVKRHDAVIASSERALIAHGILEAPVYYVPRDDVYMEHLTASDERAEENAGNDRRFLSVVASGGGVANAAWMHVHSDAALRELDGHVGFDPAIFNVTAG